MKAGNNKVYTAVMGAIAVCATGAFTTIFAADFVPPNYDAVSQGANPAAAAPVPPQHPAAAGVRTQAPQTGYAPQPYQNRPMMPAQRYNPYAQPAARTYPPGYGYNNYRRPYPVAPRRNNSGWNNMPWSRYTNVTIPVMDGNMVPWSRDVWNWKNRNRNFGNFGPFEEGPQKWFTSDPKAGLETMWDDMINAPHNMGTMPGNWQAPSVSLPNPVDLGDQVGKAGSDFARDAPGVVEEWVTPNNGSSE